MSSANGDRSHDCAPVMWAYGIPCPAMVSPNASQHKEDKLLYPDHYLVWYAKVDSGPHNEGGGRNASSQPNLHEKTVFLIIVNWNCFWILSIEHALINVFKESHKGMTYFPTGRYSLFMWRGFGKGKIRLLLVSTSSQRNVCIFLQRDSSRWFS